MPLTFKICFPHSAIRQIVNAYWDNYFCHTLNRNSNWTWKKILMGSNWIPIYVSSQKRFIVLQGVSKRCVCTYPVKSFHIWLVNKLTDLAIYSYLVFSMLNLLQSRYLKSVRSVNIVQLWKTRFLWLVWCSEP